ncbi:O-antigen polymerase [Lutibacter litoralis]|nr:MULTISPECIES: O-antigen polymerase [Flavobacteriaceae]
MFAFSFFKDTDIFSPSKIYLIILFTFFGGIFWDSYSLKINILVLLLILFGYVVILFEHKVKVRFITYYISKKQKGLITFKIWLLTLIPLFAQYQLTSKLGGFSHFISSIGGRVVEWEGMGPIILLTKLMNILNYIYFIFLVKFNVRGKKNITLYILHLIVFILIALLSGSRSNLLWNFVFMLIFYNYTVKKVSIKQAFVGFLLILSIAMIVGISREGYKIENGKLKSGLNNSEVSINFSKFSNFQYGLQPLEKTIDQTNLFELEYGLTYLTAVTNLIPRKIWPNKPESGGVIITKKHFGDPFGGFSNYTTGLIPEAIINFGILGGVLIAPLILGVLIMFLLNYQKKLKYLMVRNSSFKKNILILGVYPFLLIGINSYTYAEFTTNTISMMVYKVLLFVICLNFIFSKVFYKKN